MPEYTFFEPDTQTLEHVLLVKEDNQRSEQTFRIGVTISDPGLEIHPASLQQIVHTNITTNFDYVLDSPGNCYTVLTFRPNQSEAIVSFNLLQDELPENTEGFRASVSSEGYPFPIFQLPASTASVFASTIITIQDNDSKYKVIFTKIMSQTHMYMHMHTHTTQFDSCDNWFRGDQLFSQRN